MDTQWWVVGEFDEKKDIYKVFKYLSIPYLLVAKGTW